MHGARFHSDQACSRDRARRPLSATLRSRTFVVKENEMARCENSLVKQAHGWQAVHFGDRSDHPAKSWEDTPQAACAAVDVAADRAHPRGHQTTEEQ